MGRQTILSLPETISVKISSEAAGYVNLTPVARREMPLADVVELVLAVTGKAPSRILDILRRGSFVSGASRYRWEPIEMPGEAMTAMLARFPDSDPARALQAEKCFLIMLRGGRSSVEIRRDFASEKRFLRRRSFWDVLMQLIDARVIDPRAAEYRHYSYAEKADLYTVALSSDAVAAIHENAKLLKYSAVIEQLRYADLKVAEAYAAR